MSSYTNNNGIGYDTTFELNEFNEPKIRSQIEVVKDAVLIILFMKPGQYPSLPTVGLDIESLLYSFYDELDTEKLKDDIINNCNALGVYFNEGYIDIQKRKYNNQPSLLIHVEGVEEYPNGYMKDHINEGDSYLIGISFDELNRMVYNINSGR